RTKLCSVDPSREQQRDDRDRQCEQIERRRRRRTDGGHGYCAQIHARPAVDRCIENDRADDERDGQRYEREQLAAQTTDAEYYCAKCEPERRRRQCRRRQGPQKRRSETRGEDSSRVHTCAEERAMAE